MKAFLNCSLSNIGNDITIYSVFNPKRSCFFILRNSLNTLVSSKSPACAIKMGIPIVSISNSLMNSLNVKHVLIYF